MRNITGINVEIQGLDVVRGRYEAYVTPSNFLGEAAVHAEGMPVYGTIPDFEHDDTADIEDSYRGIRTGHNKQLGLDGMSGRERAEMTKFESKQDRMRKIYLSHVEDGLTPEQARIRASGYFGN